MDQKLAYTLDEAAEQSRFSTRTLQRQIKDGNLIARYPTSRPVIGADELQNWFEALPTEP